MAKRRYSAIVQLQSIWEIRTRALCVEISRRHPEVRVELSDLKGSALDRAKVYFSKVYPVHINVWENLEALQKIRDCIVHTGGLVKESRDSKYLKSLPKSAKKASLGIDRG